MEEQKRKPGSGGRRANCGAKPMYGEKTGTITFRIPMSHRGELSKMVKEYLQKLKASQNEQTSNNTMLN